LAMKPSVLLLDEPTANLDPDGVNQIVKAVGKVLDDTNATMVLVEHHAQPWIDLIDRVVVLGLDNSVNNTEENNYVHDDDIARDEFAQTVIVADGTPDEVFSRNDLDFENLGIWLPDKYKDPQDRRIGRIYVECEPDCDPAKGDGRVVLSTENLAISHTSTPIAKNINLKFNSGQITALVGANGAGKSTLSLTLAGLIPALEGQVVASEDLCEGAGGTDPMKWKSTDLAKRISYVFQNPEHQFACGTVLEEVAFSCELIGEDSSQAQEHAMQIIEKLNLNPKDIPFMLSRGQRQMVALAATVVTRPKILVLDEPTCGLDYNECMKIMQVVEDLRDHGCCVIMVCHDMEVVLDFATRLIVVNDGHILEGGSISHVFENKSICDEAALCAPLLCAVSQGLVKNGFAKCKGLYKRDMLVNALKKSCNL